MSSRIGVTTNSEMSDCSLQRADLEADEGRRDSYSHPTQAKFWSARSSIFYQTISDRMQVSAPQQLDKTALKSQSKSVSIEGL
jgi:hypothetical protein